MKRMHTLLIAVVFLAGCEGDVGPMGPAGTDGINGTDGQNAVAEVLRWQGVTTSADHRVTFAAAQSWPGPVLVVGEVFLTEGWSPLNLAFGLDSAPGEVFFAYLLVEGPGRYRIVNYWGGQARVTVYLFEDS